MVQASMWTPTGRNELKNAMRRFLYLGTVDKVRTALANEYSPYSPMPSAKTIQAALDERKRRMNAPLRTRDIVGPA